MRNFRKFSIAVVITILTNTAVMAGNIVDQEQLTTSSTSLAITNEPRSEQKLAQTFTVGVSGWLSQIRLPISCASGTLIVEIQTLNEAGEPTGTVVASERVPASELPAPQSDFKTIFFSPPLAVEPGDKYAIVLSNPTGTCGILSGPDGDSYAGGRSFFDARPNPPGWAGRPGDIPFQTVVDDGRGGSSSNICFGDLGRGSRNLIPLPISPDVPLCSCLSNALLNNWRCRLMHPDFFMIVQIQFPPNPPGPITERWAFTPLTKLDGPVKMSVQGTKRTMVHEFGKRSKEGSFEYFEVSRKIRHTGTVTFSYPMKNAVSPYQQEFGFKAPSPGITWIKNPKKRKATKRP